MAKREPFGTMPDGQPVEKITVGDGTITCEIITYGGAVRSIVVPAADGSSVDVALGFDTLEDYTRQDKFIGALIGRYANRIGRGVFTLNGNEYKLALNDGENHLHGGTRGFDKRVWKVDALDDTSVTLSIHSPDGEENYPGNLDVQVRYTAANGTLEIKYKARCDKDTVCNLTNHSYFNLAGYDSGEITGQYMQLFASSYTPTDAGSIPTGEISPVAGTPLDFTKSVRIGDRIDDDFQQLTFAGGYDHNWVLDGAAGEMKAAAEAYSQETGIVMKVETTLPGIQFYSGNYLDGCPDGKKGAPISRRTGL